MEKLPDLEERGFKLDRPKTLPLADRRDDDRDGRGGGYRGRGGGRGELRRQAKGVQPGQQALGPGGDFVIRAHLAADQEELRGVPGVAWVVEAAHGGMVRAPAGVSRRGGGG